MIVCSQRASTPNFLPPAPFSHASMPPSASWPVPPFEGGLAVVASRHGSRPIGNWRFGPSCGRLIVLGRPSAGSSPRCRTKMRFGTLGEHALPGAERPPFVPLDRREILRPVGNHLVGAEDVLAAFLARHRGKPRRRLTGDGVVVYEIRDRQRRNNSHDQHGQASRHVVLLQRIDGPQSRKSRAYSRE